MPEKNDFFKDGDIAELTRWIKLILSNEDIQRQIENGEMPPESQKLFITGRPAYEANIYIARQIVTVLEAKISAWEKIIKTMPEKETIQQTTTREDAPD